MPSLAEFAAATLTAYLGDVNAIHPLREGDNPSYPLVL